MKQKFTLIELLVVVSIIGILVSILLPSLQKARKKVRQTHCLNNHKQIMLCISLYTSSNDDWYPVAMYYQFELEPYARGKYTNKDDWADSSSKGTIFECLENPNKELGPANWIGGIGMNWEYMGYVEDHPNSPRQKIGWVSKPEDTFMVGDADYEDSWNLRYIYAPLSTAPFTPTLSIRYMMHDKGSNYGLLDGHATLVTKGNVLGGKNNQANWYFLRAK